MTDQHRRGAAWRVCVPVVFGAAGLLAATSFVNSDGADLRGGRSADLGQLVLSQRHEVGTLRVRARALRQQIEDLSANLGGGTGRALQRRIAAWQPAAALSPVDGPGLQISLSDAPRDVDVPDGTDPNLLVVHQQDIQGVVNALWAGGARGVTIKGQRITTTTGIKCVGNTVVLDGVPYSPPYTIAAVGDIRRMQDALDVSPAVQAYLSYTAPPYRLGWSLRSTAELHLPEATGPVQLQYARPIR